MESKQKEHIEKIEEILKGQYESREGCAAFVVLLENDEDTNSGNLSCFAEGEIGNIAEAVLHGLLDSGMFDGEEGKQLFLAFIAALTAEVGKKE